MAFPQAGVSPRWGPQVLKHHGTSASLQEPRVVSVETAPSCRRRSQGPAATCTSAGGALPAALKRSPAARSRPREMTDTDQLNSLKAPTTESPCVRGAWHRPKAITMEGRSHRCLGVGVAWVMRGSGTARTHAFASTVPLGNPDSDPAHLRQLRVCRGFKCQAVTLPGVS